MRGTDSSSLGHRYNNDIDLSNDFFDDSDLIDGGCGRSGNVFDSLGS